jgi:hypothetical protein
MSAPAVGLRRICQLHLLFLVYPFAAADVTQVAGKGSNPWKFRDNILSSGSHLLLT